MHKAVTLREIYNQTGTRPKDLSRNSKIKGIRPSVNREVKKFGFLVKSGESYSDPAGHIVTVRYPGLTLKKFRNNRKLTPMSHVCMLHCTCEAWLYWGSKYWSTQYQYNFPFKTELRAPNIRDPLGEMWACKHCIRVTNYVSKMGFEKLYRRFIKNTSSLKMASKDEIWRSASKFIKRDHQADESLLAQIYLLEGGKFIQALDENGVFGITDEFEQEDEIDSELDLNYIVHKDLFI